MTITIDLTPIEEAQLFAAAKQEGVEPKVFLKMLMKERLSQDPEASFADILAPVHEYSREQGYSEEDIGDFVDAEVASYRAERRARRTAKIGE